MSGRQLRMVAAIGLIAGGGLVAAWGVIGVLPMDGVAQLGRAVLFGSYACTGGGIGCLGWLANRTDDAITAGVTPVALGLVLVLPAVVAVTGVVTMLPFSSIFLGITVVGVLAVIFGIVLLTTLLFTGDSMLVARTWGRTAGLFATAGLLGWLLGPALADPDPPRAFMLVTPYATQVPAPSIWVVLTASIVGGLGLCLLGWALIRQPSRTAATKQLV